MGRYWNLCQLLLPPVLKWVSCRRSQLAACLTELNTDLAQECEKLQEGAGEDIAAAGPAAAPHQQDHHRQPKWLPQPHKHKHTLVVTSLPPSRSYTKISLVAHPNQKHTEKENVGQSNLLNM